eukprot:CAMPEP_0173156956 /NCGR_PEP_ID=MMETSP1105-20130129/15232_1 /TAXON_ID=2985 /ORGANISM="Ochromonas sp., Strain BG-1" /LENGTH=728 /DNA_ID=CAMNT_0014074117 /DNA_START=19 /DNA_END=2206 /DNA_ORIENTATION=-
MEESRYPKRERKPKVAYTVPSPKQKVRKSVEKVKHRNRAADGSKENKWKTYRDMIKKSVNCLLKDMQTLEVKFEGKTAPARGKNTLWELERMECEKKIFTAKQAIVTTLQAVAHENEDHKRWPQLLDDKKDVDDGEEEDDGVDVDDIFCSLCGEEETEDNDILLCDRAGCGRAYHQKCLDPPIDMMNVDPKHDWFCWQCECMDDCLDIISERLEVEYWDWKDVFPDVRMALEGFSNGEVGDTFLTADLPDDEEDDDYDPSDDDEEDGEEEDEEEDDDEEQQKTHDEVENDDRVPADNLGEERFEDEENEGNEEDEEMDDDDGDDDDDDDIDNDELQGLLEDANIPMEIVREEGEEVPISRRLRQRNQKKETVEIELLGQGDVGKLIARVRRGVFELGKILEYLPREQTNSSSAEEVESNDVNVMSGHWKVRFSKKFLKKVFDNVDEEEGKEEETSETNEDTNATEVEEKGNGEVEEEAKETIEQEGEEKIEASQKKIRDKKSEEELLLNAEDVTAGLLMYRDYTERLQRIESSTISQSRQKAIQELVESTGKLDEANIITSKRERKALDYAQLSLELFGTLADYDSSSDEDVKSDDGKKQGRRKSKQSSQRNQDDENGGEEEELDVEEIDEEIDAEWDKKREKSHRKKQSSSKKQKSNDSTKNEEKKKRPRKTDSEEKSKKKRRKETENNDALKNSSNDNSHDNLTNQEEEGELEERRSEEISDHNDM